ncbi:MAG TPA: ABC transporter ATP-binding protein [Chloroflexi bacterium]|nr:ABC transporter ATP-binding protein [Chloroflexota bacterium]
MAAIETERLKRSFKITVGLFPRRTKEILAVDNLTLSIKEGELFGLLGPNGAGKTTTVKMLTTLLLPTGGTARVLGHDVFASPNEVRKRIGFMYGGERGLYWRLSGFDNLRYFASLYHIDRRVKKERIEYLLELVGLNGRGEEKVEGYSKGMKQRLHIARTLLHDPDVLFLDEPTLGLDPVGARDLRNVIMNLQAERKTILLTTHYMFEADALCDRIAVIHQGRVIAQDTPSGLKKNVRDQSVVEVEIMSVPRKLLEALQQQSFVQDVSIQDLDQRQVLRVHTPEGADVIGRIMDLIHRCGATAGRVVVREPTLEDAYIQLVGSISRQPNGS